ncbi:MAG: NADH-quinone oxidoreductase subunit H [Methanomicrobiales archaeon]|jgi:formate hydrogenlyase subunit 4|nr:NADH-quinone oxidoreductase subunit H [Methanomicrobiales archaeon]
MNLIWIILFLVLAPFVGGLISGIDRIVTARMQGRVGPPILQPFYDIGKLFQKEKLRINGMQNFCILSYLVLIIVAGAIFFGGGDLLLVGFSLMLAHVFLVLAGETANSPYSHIGAQRELLQVMAVEPMLILYAVAFYIVAGSFTVATIIEHGALGISYIWLLPGVFFGLIYIFTIKLRKSPFDLSTSHHGHQELVKGLTTEISGPTFGLYEIAHLYEVVILLGMIGIFFAGAPLLCICALVLLYLLEVFVDCSTARVKWQLMVKSSWLVIGLVAFVNILALSLFW